MKKTNYIAPEMEIVRLAAPVVLQSVSGGNEPTYGGSGEPGLNEPD